MSKSLAKSTAASVSTKQAAETFTRLYMEAVSGTRAHLIFGAAYEWLGAVVASRDERKEFQNATVHYHWSRILIHKAMYIAL